MDRREERLIVDHQARRVCHDLIEFDDQRGVVRRVGRDAAPLTAVALALLAGGYVALTPGAAPLAALGLYLAFVAVLTLPHTVVVCALDRAQGLWDADAGVGTDGERTHA